MNGCSLQGVAMSKLEVVDALMESTKQIMAMDFSHLDVPLPKTAAAPNTTSKLIVGAKTVVEPFNDLTRFDM